MFPPLIVWALGFGLIWLFYFDESGREEPTEAAIVTAPTAVTEDMKQAVFTLPQARPYDDQIQLVAKRPLFSETRRIPEPEFVEDPPEIPEPEPVFEEEIVMEEPPIPPEPPMIIFKGFLRNGDQIQALLSLPENSDRQSDGQWVTTGDIFLGWRVREISATIVQLEKQEFKYTVEISQ